MLPEISPAVFGNVMSVDKLPPTDFSIVSAANKALLEPEPQFDIHRSVVERCFGEIETFAWKDCCIDT